MHKDAVNSSLGGNAPGEEVRGEPATRPAGKMGTGLQVLKPRKLIFRLRNLPYPDVADRHLRRRAFDFNANPSRLIIRVRRVVIRQHLAVSMPVKNRDSPVVS